VLTAPTGQLSLVVGPHPAPDQLGLDALLASAEREVLVMSTSAAAGRFGMARRIDDENLRRGVRYRVLFPDSARLSGALGGLSLGGLSLAGAEVRTDVAIPTDAVVIDRVAAVLPAERTGGRPGVAVFRLPGVVNATVGLFERIWPSAVPLASPDLPPAGEGAGLSRRERDLLALLCSGSTDESAGARLGISVRTVRRMVADIMNRVGARSRFQAGVKVADRGWLLDEAG
jgi:DNA-binding CsgD family transcriptional regulator